MIHFLILLLITIPVAAGLLPAYGLPRHIDGPSEVHQAGQSIDPDNSQEGADLERLCDELVVKNDFSGVILVAKGKRVLLEKAYGLADREAGRPNQTTSRFYVASLTKPLIAFTTLRLVDLGRIGLDDAVSKHVVELKGLPVGNVTIRQLLNHTSGLPHYAPIPELVTADKPHSATKLIKMISELKLLDEPGKRCRYSGPGYLLLGILLERAMGDSLPEIVQSHVLNPLEMDSSILVDGSNQPGDHAKLYHREATGVLRVSPRHATTLRAAGGLITTASDLHTLIQAIQTKTLLSDDIHKNLVELTPNGYAAGLIVYRDFISGQTCARHMGNMKGASAHFVFGISDDFICIALSNLSPTKVNHIDDRLMMEAQKRAKK